MPCPALPLVHPSLILTDEWTPDDLAFVLKLHPGGESLPTAPINDNLPWVKHEHCHRDQLRASYTWLIDILEESNYRYLAFVSNTTSPALWISDLLVFSQSMQSVFYSEFLRVMALVTHVKSLSHLK